jgi:hypothetical protein
MTLAASNGQLTRKLMSTTGVTRGEVVELMDNGGIVAQGDDGIRYHIQEKHFHGPRQHGAQGELRRFSGRAAHTHVLVVDGYHVAEQAMPIEAATSPKQKRVPMQATPSDPEVHALAGVVERLDGLEQEAVGRVLDYCWERYLKKPLPIQSPPRL